MRGFFGCGGLGVEEAGTRLTLWEKFKGGKRQRVRTEVPVNVNEKNAIRSYRCWFRPGVEAGGRELEGEGFS